MVISINRKQRDALQAGKKVRLQLNKLHGDRDSIKINSSITASVMKRDGGNDINCLVTDVQNCIFKIRIGE